MQYASEIQTMCPIQRGDLHPSAPIPVEGRMINPKEVIAISGLSHGVGACAPQQGAAKLTLNVKEGIIEEALIETIGCSGMTHSAAMAAEILTGKTILEAMNTDLVCDAINVAMREIFLQFAYGRTQSAFSEGGLEVGAALEDLGKTKRSQVGTSYSTNAKGVRYMELAEGYVTRLGLDENSEVIGYEYLNLGKMMADIGKGISAGEALKGAKGIYGRFFEAVKTVDPRQE
ncbi:iron-sulfur cluster assembly scaffold protein [Aliivibrio fischeri]|uniref:iron-sulfur cluster assembly scaffold protein n=1 Tax=Aliivibrio fischeri TaxID=668 RepID=UPI001F283E88|nr:iron-sulfur cluster assembly scaffold protein [Aliivibrio fischeri]MCE7554859.1 iron-sulfur cluster assembly scaffold protein [Aliivibrio fischeri]MCE7562127.1 iron-sulfur cluster assembly scaffold protein [Aliivibrio fischeri]MCE7569535.1 iron-sulfur cluster assembly scaffold protein [Aliivibrio fischeri]